MVTMTEIRIGAALVLALALAGPAGASAQTLQAGPLELDLTGRVQTQFSTTSVDEDQLGPNAEVASTGFEIRRARFGAELSFEDWLTGAVEADLSELGPVLKDAFIDARFTEALALRVGQFKKPFGLIEQTSSSKIPMIERSVRIRGLDQLVPVIGEEQYLLEEGMYVGRQVGAMLHGSVGRFGYGAGVFNGEGANAEETDGSKAYAGRITYNLNEGLALGAGVSAQPLSALDGPDGEHALAYSLDAEYGGFREPGLWLLAEAVYGEDPLVLVAGEPETLAGAQAAAAWFIPRRGDRIEGLEPVLRLSWGDPATGVDDNSGTLLTPGFNVYFSGRNRWMINGEVYLPSQDALDPEYALVTQLQIYF